MTRNIHGSFSTALELHQAGDAAAAKIEYQRFLDTEPYHLGALINLANLLAGESALDEAQAYSERATKTAPNDPNALRCAGLIRFKRGNTEQARELLTAVVSRSPGDAEAAFYLGAIAQSGGGDEAAIVQLWSFRAS